VIYRKYIMLDALDDGQEHLLNDTDNDAVEQMQQATLSDTEHRQHCRRLYISHALSTWNSRLFEFGAFLFLAKIYPNTLLPASVYALARAASAALLSPRLGSYIDSADRLKAVRLSISTHG
jgi:iron-regulated transporter 1